MTKMSLRNRDTRVLSVGLGCAGGGWGLTNLAWTEKAATIAVAAFLVGISQGNVLSQMNLTAIFSYIFQA